MNKRKKDVIVVGFALFSMFFGAGNLIFPPLLGLQSGSQWATALIAFIITGVGMPLLGVIATAKSGGTVEQLGEHMGYFASRLLGVMIIIAIGPLLAVPRVAALTYEMGIAPIFPGCPAWLGSFLFFLITFLLVVTPTKIIDHVGKWLTPVLLITLAMIIIKGIASPLSSPKPMHVEGMFSNGFSEGYQTMDALAAVIFATAIMSGVKSKGYNQLEERISITSKAAIIACIGLSLVYGGLGYLGATGSTLYPPTIDRSELLMSLTSRLWGGLGQYTLSIAVSFACLTTAVGLVSTAGDFFHRLSNQKLNYHGIVIAVCVFSGFFAVRGVTSIVNLAEPILSVLYPVIIVLIIMRMFDRYIPYKMTYKGATLGAFIVSLLQTLLTLNEGLTGLETVLSKLPFSSTALYWVVPAFVLGLVFAFYERSRGKTHDQMAH